MSSGPPRSDYYGHGGPPPPRGSGGYHRGPPPPPYERGPPPRSYRDRDRYGPPPRDRHRPYPPRGGGGPRGRRGRNSPRNTHKLITFRSFDEEQAWVEERRRKRKERPTKFDVLPTPEQQLQQQQQKAALLTVDAASIHPTTPVNAQQTRHARRLYIGNLPPMMSDAQIQQVFTDAIRTALVSSDGANNDPNPILNIYMHNERRFCFIEFKTVEMTTACMALDGLTVQGQTLKVKRPNDYNPAAAPKVHPSSMPELDVSRLGIISRTVVDGPNKIFIGGLHYHLQEHQVMELLSAFGKIKAFHLVKNDPSDINSKGYCFVEYAEPAVTPIAVEGLNGMDIGGGKSLTARLAGERAAASHLPTIATTAAPATLAAATLPPNLAGAVAAAASISTNGVQPPPNHTIVAGYDIEALVDGAMGIAPMPPMTPQYVDALGVPVTRIVPPVMVATGTAAAAAVPSPPNMTTIPTTMPSTAAPSRVLVLHNMVTDEDLVTPEDRETLIGEVREECEKFGTVEKASLYGYKIYLVYAEISQAVAAGQELKGREFAERAVDCSYVTEEEFQKLEANNGDKER